MAYLIIIVMLVILRIYSWEPKQVAYSLPILDSYPFDRRDITYMQQF